MLPPIPPILPNEYRILQNSEIPGLTRSEPAKSGSTTVELRWCLSGAGVCCRKKKFGSRTPGPRWVENLKYLSGTGVCSQNKKLSGAGVPPMEKKKLSLERTTCLADKTNHPVERLSLNRSQCGSCSTKYDTSAGT